VNRNYPTKVESIKELIYFCASNISRKVSFNSLAKLIGAKNSATVKDYFGYLEDAYLVFLLPRYSYSVQRQIFSNKKIYFIDLGMAARLGFRFSEDKGHCLENIVFLELKRMGKDIYFYSNKGECDFVVREGSHIREAIQVCFNVSEENRERELNGLLEAMDEFKLKTGIVLTYDQEEEIVIGRRCIFIKPVWKWLLKCV